MSLVIFLKTGTNQKQIARRLSKYPDHFKKKWPNGYVFDFIQVQAIEKIPHKEYYTMKKLILLLFILSAPLVAHSARIGENGKPIADTESMRSDGIFGVQLVLTPDENHFRQIWSSTKSMPKLSSTNSVQVGSSLAAVLIFTGCATNANGVCDVFRSSSSKALTARKLPLVMALSGLACNCRRAFCN